MMNALSNNPELFQAMMQSNPMMTRLMETNPQLAQTLNNPEVLRDAARAMSSPVRSTHLSCPARTQKNILFRALGEPTDQIT